MVDIEQQPIEKVAAELNTNANNLTVRLHRARQALKTSLVRACGVCTRHGASTVPVNKILITICYQIFLQTVIFYNQLRLKW